MDADAGVTLVKYDNALAATVASFLLRDSPHAWDAGFTGTEIILHCSTGSHKKGENSSNPRGNRDYWQFLYDGGFSCPVRRAPLARTPQGEHRARVMVNKVWIARVGRNLAAYPMQQLFEQLFSQPDGEDEGLVATRPCQTSWYVAVARGRMAWARSLFQAPLRKVFLRDSASPRGVVRRF